MDYVYGKTQENEMRLALMQKREPICVYGNHLLDKIQQLQYELITWTYDKRLDAYIKKSDGHADAPYHPACGHADWALIDEAKVNF